jgi:hypothetical protein
MWQLAIRKRLNPNYCYDSYSPVLPKTDAKRCRNLLSRDKGGSLFVGIKNK